MSFNFSGKVALVTGGASGIGAAVARSLAASGAKVVVADLNGDGAKAIAAEITAAGGVATSVVANVGKAEDVEAAVKAAVSTYGALHLAVNNAGIGGPAAPTGEYPLDGWAKVIDVNLNSVFYGLRYQIPALQAVGGGAIVNIASILGSVGTRFSPAYVASKHAVIGLTKAAALEYADKGIRINSVGPGYIDTPLLAAADAKVKQGLVGLHPIGRLGTAEEVAALVVFLLAEEAAFITGSYHLVDGGYTAQ